MDKVSKVELSSLGSEPSRVEDISTAKNEVSGESAVTTSGSDYSYVGKDIRRIFVLTALALGVEIFLSLTGSSSYAKLVLRTLNLEF